MRNGRFSHQQYTLCHYPLHSTQSGDTQHLFLSNQHHCRADSERKKQYINILLQLPVSLLFGLVIDFWDALLPSAGNIGIRIVYLCGSLFFTAFGIMLIVAMHLVPDPPTGAVQAISQAAKKNMGTIKIIYDCSCVVLSLLLSLLGSHRIIGFGIATIVSAVCVGRILALLQRTIGKWLKRYFPEPES